MEQGMVALHAFYPVCGVASTASMLAHWELIQIHRAELHCAVSLLNWNKAALLKDDSLLRLSTATKFQGTDACEAFPAAELSGLCRMVAAETLPVFQSIYPCL